MAEPRREQTKIRYRGYYNRPIHGSFAIIVDYESMTWISDPPGRDIPQPIKNTCFACKGPGVRVPHLHQ